MILAIDAESQVIGLIFNGLLTAGGLLGLWIIRNVYSAVKHTLARVDHIDACLDRTQEEMKRAIRETQDDIQELKGDAKIRDEEHMRLSREVAYLKAKLSIPLDQPVGES